MLRRLPASASRGVRHQASTPCMRTAFTQTYVPSSSRSLVSSVLLSNDGYEGRQVAELKALLRQRGLSQAGRKSLLIERLKENDIARAAAPATTNAAPRRNSGSRRPRGSDAAAAAAARTPTANLEPGTVSSMKDAEGNIASRSPAVAQEEVPTAPGMPLKTEGDVPNTFNVRIPEITTEPAAPQYIPTIKPVVHPSSDSPFIAHVPQVHSVVSPEHVSHASLANVAPGGATGPKITSSVASTIASEFVPQGLRRQARDAFDSLGNATGKLSEVIADGKYLLATHNPVAPPDTSNSRPSGRRPLNNDERRGLYVLTGIVLGGLTVGGLFSPRERAAPTAPAAPVRTVPHFAHGGGVVGAGARKW